MVEEAVGRVADRADEGRLVELLGEQGCAAVCVLPTLLINQFGVPFYFGGTALLIVVGVALDTVQQIEGHILQPFILLDHEHGPMRGLGVGSGAAAPPFQVSAHIAKSVEEL